MAASNDTTGSAPIQDARSAPRGVLPRQLQMWLMIGLAVIILVIILFTGHSSPVPRASAATRVPEPSLMAPDRIQTYQRQLAEEKIGIIKQGGVGDVDRRRLVLDRSGRLATPDRL